MSSSRLLVIALAALCLAGFAPAAAHADGDPASDFLITQDVFVPWDIKLPLAKTGELTRLVHAAKIGGYRLKVALIATPYDLGAITPLWRRPQRYARFLGQELLFVYKGRLLIVMPNGYGIYHHGKLVTAERKLLDGLPSPAATGADVATAGSAGVRRLVAASGITLTLAPATTTTGHGHTPIPIVVAAAVAGAWLLLTAFVLVRRRRLARAEDEPEEQR